MPVLFAMVVLLSFQCLFVIVCEGAPPPRLELCPELCQTVRPAVPDLPLRVDLTGPQHLTGRERFDLAEAVESFDRDLFLFVGSAFDFLIPEAFFMSFPSKSGAPIALQSNHEGSRDHYLTRSLRIVQGVVRGYFFVGTELRALRDQTV